MSENLRGINREQLAKALGSDHKLIRAFEQIVSDVSGFPSTIEEANALAGAALAAAQSAFESLSLIAQALDRLDLAPGHEVREDADEVIPASLPQVEQDDLNPRVYVGTLGAQNDDSAVFNGPLTSTVATGTAPFVIVSRTRVANLNVASAGTADSITNPITLPGPATDAASTQNLANAMRTALISKGIGQ